MYYFICKYGIMCQNWPASARFGPVRGIYHGNAVRLFGMEIKAIHLLNYMTHPSDAEAEMHLEH